MMEITKILKTSWFGPWLVAAVCVLVLTPAMPQKAAATAVEYAVMLALIIVVSITAIDELSQNPAALNALITQFQAAAAGAALANTDGNRPKEIGGLGKTIGLAEALMGLTSPCNTCDTLRTQLQQIIGIAAFLKGQALGVASTCNPDGVIEDGEQCDPLIQPNGGCPILTVPSFCNARCQCEISP